MTSFFAAACVLGVVAEEGRDISRDDFFSMRRNSGRSQTKSCTLGKKKPVQDRGRFELWAKFFYSTTIYFELPPSPVFFKSSFTLTYRACSFLARRSSAWLPTGHLKKKKNETKLTSSGSSSASLSTTCSRTRLLVAVCITVSHTTHLCRQTPVFPSKTNPNKRFTQHCFSLLAGLWRRRGRRCDGSWA